jgi:hypothetical protein
MNKRNNLTHIRTLIKARGREMPSLRGQKVLSVDPEGALADIQALVRVALGSTDPDVMRRDLELILTITEEALKAKARQ